DVAADLGGDRADVRLDIGVVGRDQEPALGIPAIAVPSAAGGSRQQQQRQNNALARTLWRQHFADHPDRTWRCHRSWARLARDHLIAASAALRLYGCRALADDGFVALSHVCHP